MPEKSLEELAVTFDDVEGPLSQPVLRDRVEQIVYEDLRYREAFRNYDATGINSNVVQMPVPKDNMGSPKVVDEGSEFPRSKEEYELETLDFEKFGFEISLTMEAVEDSQTDLVQDQLDKQAREMRRDMNERAFNEINDSISSVVGDENDTLTFSDILAGRQELVGKSYNPDLLIVDVEGSHDLLDSDNFLSATEAQSSLRRSGEIGQIAGMSVIEDDSSHNFTGGAEGVMIDTDYFGYEGERTPVTTEEYEEKRTQGDVYRIFGRYGWLTIDEDAGVIIDG